MVSRSRFCRALKQTVLVLFVMLPGIAIAAVSAHFLLGDWAALARAFRVFETAVGRHEDLASIYAANAYQQTYRTNCFADGVGALGGLIIFSIGLVGLCLLRREESPRRVENIHKHTVS